MNLIEELGGYDSARRYVESRKGADDESVYLALCGELLEHRIENNIFEVGDAMIIASRGNGIFYFNELISKDDLIESRHATPEEIKAGHRL